MPNDPMHVVKRGKKFCAVGVNATGKPGKGRCHATKAEAVAQVQAINLNMIKRGTLKPKKKK